MLGIFIKFVIIGWKAGLVGSQTKNPKNLVNPLGNTKDILK